MPCWTAKVSLIRVRINLSFGTDKRGQDTLLWTQCCSCCFLGCANWETFVADTKCFWTKSETFVSRTQNLCPQQMLRARANGETFVSATICPQQCVHIARAFRTSYVISISITNLTFAMLLLKLSTFSAAIFLFVSLVLSLLCVWIPPRRSTGVFHYCFLQHSLSDVDIRHWYVYFSPVYCLIDLKS